MHNSDDPERQIAAVRLYMDESDGDDPGTPHAVIGGILVNRSGYELFEDKWDQLLDRHGIDPPLHMKEFGRPDGRFAAISDCCRRELFIEVAELINRYKLGSITTSITNEEYKTHIPEVVRDKFSVYGMCFNLAVMLNHKLAVNHNYNDRIPLFLDKGNPYKGHVVEAHAAALEFQRHTFLHVGSLTFDDDKDFGVLQAADVIAWGSRRRESQIPLVHPFAPIGKIFAENHVRTPWESGMLKDLATSLMISIAEEEGNSQK